MLELFTTKPIFQGNDEIHQLQVVYDILGSPNPADWPGLTELPWHELVKPRKSLKGGLRELFRKCVFTLRCSIRPSLKLFLNRWLSPAGLDLAETLLTYDPSKRATAAQALEASYFTQEEPPEMLPEYAKHFAHNLLLTSQSTQAIVTGRGVARIRV